MIWAIIMMIVMVVLNRGGFPNTPVMGFKYWQYLKSDFANNIIFGLFRPAFNLHDDGTSSPSEGIGGDKGRFMSLLTAILVVCYAYSGTEIVCIAACEAKNPRKALPSATRRVFWRIIIFYVLSAFWYPSTFMLVIRGYYDTIWVRQGLARLSLLLIQLSFKPVENIVL